MSWDELTAIRVNPDRAKTLAGGERQAPLGNVVRRVAAGLSVVAISVATGVGLSGVAYADAGESRSYPGCPLLIEGSSGDCVERLQRDLNIVNSAYNLPETGFFGEQTRIAVLDFQGRNGLAADGNVGAETASEVLDQTTRTGFVPSPRPGDPLSGSSSNEGTGPSGGACDPHDPFEPGQPTTMDYLSGRVCPPEGFPYHSRTSSTPTLGSEPSIRTTMGAPGSITLVH